MFRYAATAAAAAARNAVLPRAEWPMGLAARGAGSATAVVPRMVSTWFLIEKNLLW